MRALQSWIRRCTQTLRKLHFAATFVKSHSHSGDEKRAYDPIIEDYLYLATTVQTYYDQLQAKIPIVTSLIQITDTRQSLREAANIKRLTNLALLFVPLSFTTSLLAMNDSINLYTLGLFLVLAIPLCSLVFIIARWPEIKLHWFAQIS